METLGWCCLTAKTPPACFPKELAKSDLLEEGIFKWRILKGLHIGISLLAVGEGVLFAEGVAHSIGRSLTIRKPPTDVVALGRATVAELLDDLDKLATHYMVPYGCVFYEQGTGQHCR